MPSRRYPCALLFVLLTLGSAVFRASAEEGGERIETPVADASIAVFKARRELRLYSGDELLRTYRVGLGFEPVADKVRQGDGATPEGEYIVVVKNPQSQYHLSLGLNYPNAADAERGLEAGLISRQEAARITEADKKGRRPPWDTALGGEIFIHGRGSSADWTLGCVALDDPDIEELYAAVKVGTPVTVKP